MRKVFILAIATFFSLGLFAGIFDGKGIYTVGEAEAVRIVEMAGGDHLVVHAFSSANYPGPVTKVTRLNSQDSILWSKELDGTANWGLMDCGSYPNGDAYFVYWGYGIPDHVALRLDKQGQVAWCTAFNVPNSLSSDYQYSNLISAKLTPEGNLAFVADNWAYMGAAVLDSTGARINSFFCTIQGDTCIQCDKNPGFDIAPNTDGSFIITGKRDYVPMIVYVNPSGNADWVLSYYSSDYYTRPYSITATADGNYLIGGLSRYQPYQVFTGCNQMSLVKINRHGAILWAKSYAPPVIAYWGAGPFIRQIVENADSTFTVIGDNACEDGSTRSFYATLSPNGDLLSAWLYGPLNVMSGGLLFKSPTGEAKVNFQIYIGDSVFKYISGVISLDDTSNGCNVSPLNLVSGNIPWVTDTTTFTAASIAPSAVSHPDIIPVDFIDTLTLTDLCIVRTTGIASVSPIQPHFTIVPNPATNATTITTGMELTGGIAIVTDITGRQVNSFTLIATATDFNTSGLPDGIYLISIRKGELSAVKKLVVQR